MRQLRQLEALLDGIPVWGQILIGLFLVVYSILSVYGRMNPSVGRKLFSKIPESEIKTNKLHILSYTVVPVFVTLGYFILLFNKYSGS